MFNIRKINPEMAYHLRQTILRPNQPIEDSMYETDFASSSFHIGAFHQGKLISVASFIVDHYPDFPIKNQYRLRQMATHENFRRLGSGRSIVNYAENIIKERNVHFLWCKARTNVKGYYKKLGFKTYGKPFDYPPIGPHIMMYKKLTS